jgi:hypothetical protein
VTVRRRRRPPCMARRWHEAKSASKDRSCPATIADLRRSRVQGMARPYDDLLLAGAKATRQPAVTGRLCTRAVEPRPAATALQGSLALCHLVFPNPQS